MKRNSTIVGIGLLVIIVMILLSSPALFFSPTVTFIDTEAYKSTTEKIPVKTKTDFGSQEVMSTFPLQIEGWEGSEYETAEYVELLGADTVLIRIYISDNFTQNVFLTIVQSKTESSFHPPKICFTGQGWEIQEEGQDKVDVKHAEWIKGSPNLAIPLKKMVITQTAKDGQLTERRVVLFCYVKGNPFYADTITMIQTEALAPLTGPYEAALNEQKAFLAQAIPLMFSPVQTNSQWKPLGLSLAQRGAGGRIMLALLLIIPLGIIVYPRVRGQKKNR